MIVWPDLIFPPINLLNYKGYIKEMSYTTYSKIYMLGIKPKTVWTIEEEDEVNVVSLSEMKEGNILFNGDLLLDVVQYSNYPLVQGKKGYSIDNKEEFTTFYIVMIKEKKDGQ